MTYTEQALQIATRQQFVAKRDNGEANNRGIKFTPGGYCYLSGVRISFEAAVQQIAACLEAEANAATTIDAKVNKTQPRRTDFTWDRLNQNTKDFFFNICDQMQTISRDHDMIVPVAVKELRIGLTHAPRLTNLKKAGLIEGFAGLKKSHKMLRLTEEGRSLWASHV